MTTLREEVDQLRQLMQKGTTNTAVGVGIPEDQLIEIIDERITNHDLATRDFVYENFTHNDDLYQLCWDWFNDNCCDISATVGEHLDN